MSDPELHRRLRAADPAGALPPDPDRAARLVEDVMSTELTEESRESGLRHRGRLTWLVAAAAVVVIAVAGAAALRAVDTGKPDPVAESPQQTQQTQQPDEQESVTTLTVAGGAGTERCMVPNAETLATADLAVEGTIADVSGERATLTPTHWYAGDPTDRVEVVVPSEQPLRLENRLELRRGGHYLLAAADDRLFGCGMSGPYTDGLAALYQKAFPG